MRKIVFLVVLMFGSLWDFSCSVYGDTGSVTKGYQWANGVPSVFTHIGVDLETVFHIVYNNFTDATRKLSWEISTETDCQSNSYSSYEFVAPDEEVIRFITVTYVGPSEECEDVHVLIEIDSDGSSPTFYPKHSNAYWHP